MEKLEGTPLRGILALTELQRMLKGRRTNCTPGAQAVFIATPGKREHLLPK